MTALPWTYDDGGRAAAGYKGEAGDCACRAIAIATGMTYQETYDLINKYALLERPRDKRKRSHARTGVHRATLRKIMADLGWTWVPTMQIGSGTKVHLAAGELPGPGEGVEALLAACSKHYVAVVDGVVRDTHDPTRDGTRAVYGYYRQ